MALKFRRGTAAQKSGSLAFGEPYVNTTLGTLQVGLDTGDVTLTSVGATTQFEIQSVSASSFISASTIYATNGLTGSIAATNGIVSGSSQIVYTGLSNIPAGIISSSTQIDTLFNIDGLISGSSQVIDILSSLNSYTASNDTTNTTQNSRLDQLSTVSGSAISRLNTLESETLNLELFTSSINTTIKSKLDADGVVSGSLVSLLPTGVVSGSSQIDVMSTTNIARLATTGSNSFNGNQTITGSVTVSSAVNAASVMVNGYLEVRTGTDVNSVKIGRNTGGTATRTVAIGYSAGNAGGSYNVAIGDQASSQLAGSNNVVIGATSLNSTINASSNTVVGSNTGNTVALGNTNTLIGAGISLGVGSATNTIIGASVSQGVITDNIILANGSGAIKFRFDGTNNNLIGNSVVSGSLTVTGSISAGGDIVAYSTSDRRHKNNIVLISDALSKVTKLNGVTWEWNDDVDAVTKQSPKTGLIAQEVQEVLPEVVTERQDGFLALDYSKMMGLMVEAIKEQQTQIHSLTLEIEKLKEPKGL